jgi:glycosyltransferase involved in cell wall biosynthesis
MLPLNTENHTVSAIIISFNEGERIAGCLKSLQGIVDEIVLVDNGSTDDTIAIAKQYGAKVFHQDWLGYGPQKNVAISHTSHNYILQIDCDERLDETLAQSILREKAKGLQGAYEIPFLHNYYGKFIRHGLQFPDKKLRLWNKQDFVWDNREVHESLLMPANYLVCKLKGFMLHYTYTTLAQHIAKSNRYSTEGANQLFAKDKNTHWWKIWASPFFTFLNAYFFKLGLLDGWHGFIIAVMESTTTFMKYAKLWEMNQTTDLE